MTRQTLREWIAAMTVTTAFAIGCDRSPVAPEGPPKAPTAAAPAPMPTPTVRTYMSIEAVVSNVLNERISGAVVRIIDGPGAGTSGVTDVDGIVTLRGTFDSVTPITLQASHDGAAGTLTFTPSGTGASTSASLYLNASDSAAIELGVYDVTFESAASCPDAPVDLRSRTYAATITRPDEQSAHYRVQLAGQFLSTPLGYTVPPGAFDLFAFGRELGIPGTDGDTFFPVWEQLAPNIGMTIGFAGFPAMSVPTQTVSALTLPLQSGVVDYCEWQAGTPLEFGCADDPHVVRHVTCTFRDGRLLLRRR